MYHHKKLQQRGMTFIEVLIALVLIVTGILGAVAMQATAKKGSFDAMQRALASALAQDIIERMRSNDASGLANYAGTDYGAALDAVPASRCNNPAAVCTPTAMVTNDRYEWELALMGADVLNGTKKVGGLTGARGCITVTNINEVSVTISWQGRTGITDSSTGTCGASGDKRRQITIGAFIF
ncbi:type IV pilus modification protein PilV [Thalassotalea profundi]|uniref:Type IV pilus modification protein PilV n=1 Tax=Thalassotalea profundi TaxID=2036687 RepID=A0ABQ3IFX4_9GAMM|nr:type IV pilus modification protein PilV [Thalassotalea profundi]GHE79813.1 type IV pilus modification protein PilV [Thalassotalea profundi]